MVTQIALLLLIISALIYFLSCVGARLAGICGTKTPLPKVDVRRRLIATLIEIALQTRVIRDRPMAGVLHALVMWGFLVFSWVTGEHVYQGFVGLEKATSDRSWYGTFAAIWAFAVLVGIIGLAFRRFVIRPHSLGPISPSSGMVAVLITLLMGTYLLGWRVLEIGSMSWYVNWWVHVGLLLAMALVIPNSKHLHVILAPVAILFRGSTISSIRALRKQDDEDVGMRHFSDLSAKDILDVNACVECGRCTDVCPVNSVGGSLNPKEIILQMQRGLLERAEVIAGTVSEVQRANAWVSEDDLFQCLSCGACEYSCPVGIEHVGAKILDLRRGLVSEGRTNSKSVAELFTSMERVPHNPWSISNEVRMKFIESARLPIFDNEKDWLLWLGCGNSYDSHGQDVAIAMAKILDAAGMSWGVLQQETCCGEPARRAGNEYLYMELSSKVTKSFLSHGVKNLVTCCPHCVRMFEVDYMQDSNFEKLGIRILHHTELIEELRNKLVVDRRPEKVVYHDPCYLARGRGITEEPRNTLKASGVSLIEPARHGHDTFCCGAGGAQIFIADDIKSSAEGRVNHKRFSELAKTGATTFAVSCPYCPIMLNDAAQHANRNDIRVVDVAELLAERLLQRNHDVCDRP